MTDNADIKSTVIPQEMAQLEWVWVLTTAITKHRDSMFVLEMDGQEGQERRRVVPIFENREDAIKLKLKICQHKSGDYSEQAMRLSDVGTFAAKINWKSCCWTRTAPSWPIWPPSWNSFQYIDNKLCKSH